MSKIKDILREKRKNTEKHIKEIQQEGKNPNRYTIMMPNIPFMILGLLSDVGWVMYLVSEIIYLCKNGFQSAFDYLNLIIMIILIIGILYISYLNKTHEKEIATRLQKDLSFGVIAFCGLIGAIIGILQIISMSFSLELVFVVIGGFINFAFGLPIYLSFKKGIFYGVE